MINNLNIVLQVGVVLKKNYEIGIRVDMGEDVGSGHFFRCLALANELTKKNRSVIFVSKTKSIKNHLRKNTPFLILKGKNESEQIKECKKFSEKIKFWIIDLPKGNGKYSFHLRKYNSAIIDDLGNFNIYSKFLFNGGIIKKFQKYNNKTKTKLFKGPEFMILRKEFNQERKNMISKKSTKKILLTFGGNDDFDLTLKILSGLKIEGFSITVLLGPTYKFLQKIQKMKKNIKIIKNIKNTSKLFSEQDLVISTPGITSYELACLGIPTIFIPINKEQNILANKFEKKGFGINFGFFENNILELNEKTLLIHNYKKTKTMIKAGRKIIDGKGVFRVAKIIDEFLE